MKSLHIKLGCIVFLVLLFAGASVSKVYANVPDVTGKVTTTTGSPIANVWVKWVDAFNNIRYAKTNSAGVYFFTNIQTLASTGELQTQAATQIDTNLDGVLDAYQLAITGMSVPVGLPTAFACDTSPHGFSVIMPVGWAGNFSEITDFLMNNSGITDNLPELLFTSSAKDILSYSGNVFFDDNGNNQRDTFEANYQGGGGSITSNCSPLGVDYRGITGFYTLDQITTGQTCTISYSPPAGYPLVFPPGGQYTVNYVDKKTCSVIPAAPEATCDKNGISQINFVLLSNGAPPPIGPTSPPSTPTPTPTPIPVYSVSGVIFLDDNRNGIKDGGEGVYSGATITLSGGSSGTAVSNGSGNYTFANLLGGSYNLSLTVPATYQATTTNPRAVSVGPNQTVNFGIVRVYTVTGNIIVDLNKNGIKDASEQNYTGAITINSSQGLVQTFSGGTYSISGLTAGTYTVSYPNLPLGYFMTSPRNGPPPSFQVIVGPNCNTNGAPGAVCQ